MSSQYLFILAVALLTLGGVFFYLLRVEALAKRLEEQVRDANLNAPLPPLDEAPTASALDPQRVARELPRP